MINFNVLPIGIKIAISEEAVNGDESGEISTLKRENLKKRSGRVVVQKFTLVLRTKYSFGFFLCSQEILDTTMEWTKVKF